MRFEHGKPLHRFKSKISKVSTSYSNQKQPRPDSEPRSRLGDFDFRGYFSIYRR